MSEASVKNAPVRERKIDCVEPNKTIEVVRSEKPRTAIFTAVEGRTVGRPVEIGMTLLFEAVECVRAATPPSGAPLGHRRPTEDEMKQEWSLEPHADVNNIVMILPDYKEGRTVRCTVNISDLNSAVTYVILGVGDDHSQKETVSAGDAPRRGPAAPTEF